MTRLFFALWPDQLVRDELYRAARTAHQASGGRLVRRDNLHQTLVFVGDMADERIAGLKAAAGAITGSAFTFEWGTTGYWRHNRILWAAPNAMPGPLTSLVLGLVSASTAHGVERDARPYSAHVTLVREARSPSLLPQVEFSWQVRDFALVESRPDARGVAYRVIARWPLAG